MTLRYHSLSTTPFWCLKKPHGLDITQMALSLQCYLQMRQLDTEDWIGLKTLDDAGRVKYVSVAGNHLAISDDDMKKHMVPYLESHNSTTNSYKISCTSKTPITERLISKQQEPVMAGLSMYNWPSSVTDFFGGLVGIVEDH